MSMGTITSSGYQLRNDQSIATDDWKMSMDTSQLYIERYDTSADSFLKPFTLISEHNDVGSLDTVSLQFDENNSGGILKYDTNTTEFSIDKNINSPSILSTLLKSNSNDLTLEPENQTDVITLGDTNGYVGINNTSPQSQLDVNGNVTISGKLTTLNDGFTYYGAKLKIGYRSSNYDTGIYLDFTGSDTGIYNSNSYSLAGNSAPGGHDFDGLNSYALRFRNSKVFSGDDWGFIFENASEERVFSINSNNKSGDIVGDFHTSGKLTNTGGAKLDIHNGSPNGANQGIHMYGANDTNWGIYMAPSESGKSLAGGNAVSGHNFGFYAIRLRGYNDADEGFIFEDHNENRVMSINSGDKSGDIVGDFNISGKLTNTGGSKLEVQNGVDGSSGHGIFMWKDTDTAWGIYMAQSGSGSSLADNTAVSGHDFTSHAIRLRTNTPNDGFIFENSSEERIFSINSDNKSADIVGDFNTSGKLTNTGGSKLEVQNGVDGGSNHGIFMWQSDRTDWGIYMAQSGSGNSLSDGTAVSGHNFTNHAIRLRSGQGSTNGFIFENENEERMLSINSGDKSGDIVGDLTVGRWLYMNDENMKIGDSNNDGSSFEFTNTNDSEYGIVHTSNGTIYMKGSSRVQIESYLDMRYNTIKNASNLSVETLNSTQAKNKITSNTTLDMSDNNILVSGYNLLSEIENIAFVADSGIASLQSQFDSLGALAYYNDMSLNGIVQETSNGYTYVPQRLGVTTNSPQYSIDTGTSDIRTRTTYFDYGSGHSFIGYSDDGWGRDRAELYLFSNGSVPSSIDMGLNNTTDSNTYYTFESFAGTGESYPYNNDDDKLTLWEGPALNGYNVIWSYYPARNQFDIDKPTEIRNTLNVQNKLTNTGGSKLEIHNGNTGGSGNGIFIYKSDRTDWGIYMSQSGSGESLNDNTAVSGHNFNGDAIRFRTNTNSKHGFIFENKNEERVISINSTDKSGNIVGNFGVGQSCYLYIITEDGISFQDSDHLILLTEYKKGDNECIGKLIGFRSSGHYQAVCIDILFTSASSNSNKRGYINTQQGLENGEQYTLVSCTYNGTDYLAIRYQGEQYAWNKIYFMGLIESTKPNDKFKFVKTSNVSNLNNFSNSNTKQTIQARDVYISGNLTVDQWCYMNGQQIRVGDRNNNGKYAELTNLNDSTWGIIHQNNGDVRLKGSNRVKADRKLENNDGAKLEVQNSTDGGSNHGIFMWKENNTSWGIYMAKARSDTALNDGSAPSGHNFSSHAIRFRTNDNNSNGFIFEDNSNNRIFSINSGDNSADFNGSVSKLSGSFDIQHPNPDKANEGYRLRHSFVESNTRGDNIYRYTITTTYNEEQQTIELPSYFPYLNENAQAWIDCQTTSTSKYPGGTKKWFNNELTKLTCDIEKAGTYNILIIATRKDEAAKNHWDSKGIEYLKEYKD